MCKIAGGERHLPVATVALRGLLVSSRVFRFSWETTQALSASQLLRNNKLQQRGDNLSQQAEI